MKSTFTHYPLKISEIDGDPAAHDCVVSFWHDGQKIAVATVGRDLDSLRVEPEFEQKLRS